MLAASQIRGLAVAVADWRSLFFFVALEFGVVLFSWLSTRFGPTLSLRELRGSFDAFTTSNVWVDRSQPVLACRFV